jgi:hypothetical protein
MYASESAWPSVVSSKTLLVTYGSSVTTISAKYAPEFATLKVIRPSRVSPGGPVGSASRPAGRRKNTSAGSSKS